MANGDQELFNYQNAQITYIPMLKGDFFAQYIVCSSKYLQ